MNYEKKDTYTAKDSYALTESNKNGHLEDAADTYAKSHSRSWKESVQEAQAEIDASFSDTRYYMCMPRDYVVKRGIRTLMIFFVCILCCHSVLTIATPPMFLYSFLKWNNYCKFCASMNISAKKLNRLLVLWFLLCIGINILFWHWIGNILL